MDAPTDFGVWRSFTPPIGVMTSSWGRVLPILPCWAAVESRCHRTLFEGEAAFVKPQASLFNYLQLMNLLWSDLFSKPFNNK